jgi:Secretory lipase
MLACMRFMPSRLCRILATPACAVAMLAAWQPTTQAQAQAKARAQAQTQVQSPVPPSQDPFYMYTGSTPLSQIAPGTVLKARNVRLAVTSLAVPAVAEQVLYRTTGEQGQPTVTVTTIIRPRTPLSTKIVSYQTAYDALGSQCDPSYTLRGGNSADSTAQAEAALLSNYVNNGYIVTVPDYEGTSLDWGAGQESGYGTLDGIRATERYLRLPSSTPVGMLGYSGGAIATEWASELAPSYAPHLHIVGAASGGVPVDLAHNLTYINGDQDWAGVIPAVLVSLSRAFGIGISQYLSAYGEQVTSQVSSECIAQFSARYPGLTIQQLLLPRYQNPFKIPALVTIMNKLVMGTGGTPAEPVLLGAGNADGTGDGIMVTADVQQLAYEYCQRHVPVTFDEFPGLDHYDAAIPFEVDATAFLKARFAGLPVSSGCASITPGNPLTPLPMPVSHLKRPS